jgi:hypothetical protein
VPAQLLQRLNRFLDQQTARDIMALAPRPGDVHARDDLLGPPPVPNPRRPNEPRHNTRPHWPGGSFGAEILATNVQSVIIHETSGWPSHASSKNFRNLFRCIDDLSWVDPTPRRAGRWINRRGIGPQYFVEQNGTAFTLIGPVDLAGNPRLTWHGEAMNRFSVGIENADIGDSGVTPGNGSGPSWWRLSDEPEDLPGMKAYLVLHPGGTDVDAVLVWIAQFPRFAGSGDIDDGHNPVTDRRLGRHPEWKNMLFSERNYRSLALLSRLIAEQNGLPRNFPLLPYLDDAQDGDTPGLFRQLLLSDQRCDAIAVKLGTTTAIVRANAAAFTTWYNSHTTRDGHGNFVSNSAWQRFFGVDPAHIGAATADVPCFRGFLSHDINGGHPCPGPLFDWHRFAREVWDWWWYPFDAQPVGVSTTLRPYIQARRSTQLIDHYYDAVGAPQDYNRLRAPLTTEERFVLPDVGNPIYAMANGVVVAARFALDNNPAASGFLLVRHEVFHQGAAGRINYDLAPTFVWSLTWFMQNVGFGISAPPTAIAGALPATNPAWLNRFIVRLRESELAVQFHDANPNNTALRNGWAHAPSGAGPRVATGQEITNDATGYRRLATDLAAGLPVLFPLEANANPTPVRVILGDFLGFPNRMSADQSGVQIEILSKDQLPVPGAARRACSASTEAWWHEARGAARNEAVVAMNLPEDDMAWHYPMTNFLQWVNHTTWLSEWAKYGAAGTAPERPLPRRVT